MASFSDSFLTRELRFMEGGCLYRKDTQKIDISDTAPSKEQLKEVVEKIRSLNLSEILMGLSTQKREYLLNNLFNLRHAFKASFLIEVTTVLNLNQFSDCIACHSFSLQHFTSFPRSHPLRAIPTDHGGIKETDAGFHLAICDGLGHHEPEGIGRIAAEVLQTLMSRPLSSERKNYPKFLQRLNQKLRASEGTTILEADIERNKRGWKIRVANYGDSALIVLDIKGKVQFKTKDHTWKEGQLGVGAGFSDSLIQHAELETYEINEGFLIACSDGLTEPYIDKKTGDFDRVRFEKSYLKEGFLNIHTLSNLLSHVAIGNAINNGDDTTIIAVNLTK